MARIPKMKKTAQRTHPVQHPVHTRCVQRVKDLVVDGASSYRYRLEDPLLEASIQKYGMLMPLLVSGDVRPVVIAGHKRLHVARKLKLKEVPALVTGKRVSPKEALILNLVSNWKEICPDMDRAKALGTTARALGFSDKELLLEVMPLLGLSGDKATLDLYLKLDRFSGALKDFIADGKLPLRGVSFLVKFSEKDQAYFAKEIGSKIRLTSSQLLQTGEWLSDMMRGTGQTLRDLFQKHQWLKGLDLPGMDPRMRADKLFARVRQLRSPHYARSLAQFEERSGAIVRDAKGLRLEPIQSFEEPGFELHARVRTPEEFERLLRELSGKRTELNSLFEIVL